MLTRDDVMCYVGLSDAALGEGTGNKLRRLTARDIAQVRVSLLACICERVPDNLLVILEYQGRMIAQFPKVLQRLEDMLLALAARAGTAAVSSPDGTFGICASIRLGEVVVHVLLQLREFAVVVLDNLRWKIVQDVLLETTQ